MSKQINHIYEFGEFHLETAERLLLRQGKPISLTPKAFETLLVLVRSGGHVVEKDELMKRVWADAFVEEANLARNVWALRKALGDDNGEHSYIETVPKLGYRFVAPVTELADEDAGVLIQRRIRARIVSEEEETSEEPPPQTEVETPTAPVAETIRPTSALSLATPRNRKRRSAVLGLLVIAALAVALLITGILIRDARSGSAARPIESVAVMPFTNLSNDPELDYLSEGLTENLINRLSHVSRLKIIARNSVFRYKGKQIDPQQVGSELGVQAVLIGRLETRGDELSISGELVDARDGTHLWGDHYERKISDLQSLQRELAQDMATALRLQFSGEEKARLVQPSNRNPEAYQLYLKGRYFWNKRTPEDLERAADYFQQAITKDPNYALAYSGLADAYFYMGYAFGRTPPKEAMPKAKAAALKALELDDNLAEAHTSLGLVKFVYDWDWAGAESEFKRAIQLNPNYPSAYHFYSAYLICVPKRFDEAIAVAKRGIELDPLSIPLNNILANHLDQAGRYDEAIEQRRKVLELNPNDASQHIQLSESYAAKGMYDEAFAERLRADAGMDKEKLEEYRRIYVSSGWSAYLQKKTRDELERIPRKLNQQNHTNLDTFFAVENYAALGEKDKAFEWLDRMYEDRNGMLIWLKVAHPYDPLRSDPRFEELVRRVGLPE